MRISLDSRRDVTFDRQPFRYIDYELRRTVRQKESSRSITARLRHQYFLAVSRANSGLGEKMSTVPKA